MECLNVNETEKLPIETCAICSCLDVKQPSTSGLSSTPIVAPNLGGLLHTVTGDSGSSTTSTTNLYPQSDQACHSMQLHDDVHRLGLAKCINGTTGKQRIL